MSPRDLRRTLSLALLGCLALIVLGPRAAMAEEPETPPPQQEPLSAPPPTPPSNDDAADTEASQHLQDIDPAIVAADRLRHVSLLGSPFGLVVGRVSAEVQLMVALHHAIVLNPFVRVVDDFVLLTTSGRRELGYGAEIGYRYFSGRRGANGLFIGPSVVVAHDHVAAGIDSHSHAVGTEDPSFLGAIIDVGAQGILESGFTIGGGAGGGALLRFGGNVAFTPRLLFTLGYSF